MGRERLSYWVVTVSNFPIRQLDNVNWRRRIEGAARYGRYGGWRLNRNRPFLRRFSFGRPLFVRVTPYISVNLKKGGRVPTVSYPPIVPTSGTVSLAGEEPLKE